MELFIESNIDRAAMALSARYATQIPFAASVALNNTAYRIAKRRLPTEAQRNFEGGAVRFTKSGFGYTKSNKRNLVATIFNMENRPYLALQIHGGVRQPPRGGGAIILPSTHSRRTKEGNVSRKMRRNYLSKAENARVNGGRRRGTSTKGAFIGIPKGRDGLAQYGIWQRQGKRLKLLLAFERTPISYQKKFKFYKYSRDEFHRYFDNELAVALQKAIG